MTAPAAPMARLTQGFTGHLHRRPLLAELLAEFGGTFVLILIGDGVVAAVVAGGIGSHDSIAWAWGLGVTFGVYTAARLSGGHLNPAVTLAMAVFRGFAWRKVLPYSLAQLAGAFVAALVVRWNYSEALAHVDPGHTAKTQIVFSTLPSGVGLGGAFRDQVIGTAILLLLVLVLTAEHNAPPLANLAPFVVGLVVVAIGMAWGVNAGYAINPARDLGPRLASWLTGYADAWVTPSGQQYWWVPIAGPLVGALVGGLLFELFVGRPLAAHPDLHEPGRVPPEEQVDRNVVTDGDRTAPPTDPPTDDRPAPGAAGREEHHLSRAAPDGRSTRHA